MYKLKIIIFNKINIYFYTINLNFVKNNFFITLTLNNFFLKYESFNYLNSNKIILTNIGVLNNFLNYFTDISLGKKLFFEFKITGLKYSIKYVIKSLILNFLKNLKFKQGNIFLKETTF